jgi:ADP-ribosylation factor-binding protein GGA
MEEEERAAQSAKLQELIRRGGPEDLQEANRLMKVMAGYDTRHKTDYRAKAAEEVSKIQQKAKILEEMLQSHRPGDKVGEGDVFEELASALQSAHPKIQKMCEEESDDSEAVAKLLEINDSIHRTVERYKLVKKGDVEAASKIPKGTLGTSTGVGKNAANELSLIDFDPEPTVENGTSQAATGPQATTVEDDLLGLSMEEKPSGQTGLISLGFGTNSGVPGPPLLSSTMQQNSAASPTSTSSSPRLPRSNYDVMSSLTGPSPFPKPASPSPMQQQQRQQQKSVPGSHVSADPFAALVAPSSRSSSPFNRQPTTKPVHTSLSLLELADSSSQTGASSRNGVAVDDEWNFASSLPENTFPTSQRLEVHSSSIKIEFLATRPAGQQSIRIMAQFSNNTAAPIHGLHFQVAVEKV